jgi:two-component system sensor histidine kinase KdpD
MTRLESGAMEPKADQVELADLVGSALRRARKVLAGHKVEVDLAADLPMLRLDPVLFEQVVFNVLDNAAKYTPPGSRIRIEGRRDQDMVRLRVLDEGDGIPPEDLERIFDKFYRIHAEDRRRAGTGLGLAICRGFIEAMGGTIVAGNRDDRRGAVFTITMPAPAGVEQASPRAASA